MGMDLSYQAIPHDSPALERARRDALFCCELEFMRMHASSDLSISKMYERARENPRGEEDRAFVDAVDMARSAAREHPGIESRHFDWSGRGYDAVHYLLSPARRDGNKTQDWAHGAIYGAQVLCAQGTSTIGFPIRYSSPESVREYAEILGAATRDDLHKYFDAAGMKYSGVYKYFSDPDGFENWMWPEFEAWRDFLLQMRSFPDEGLICSIG